MGTSLSTASPRRVFHDPFRFQPAFHTSFPGFSSDNHVLTRFSYIHGLSTEGSFSRVSFLHIGSTFHISPRHIRGGLQTTEFLLFPTIFIIRSMSAEGISIKRMVKITHSCSIFNSQRCNPPDSKDLLQQSCLFLIRGISAENMTPTTLSKT